MQLLEVLKKQMLATADQQISLTDPDARSMATSGHGSGVVGYNVQVAVDTAHHLIITHEVTNVGTDRSHCRRSPRTPRRSWERRTSMPSLTAVTSAVSRFWNARTRALRLRCQSR
jgi:hypothetical protein